MHRVTTAGLSSPCLEALQSANQQRNDDSSLTRINLFPDNFDLFCCAVWGSDGLPDLNLQKRRRRRKNAPQIMALSFCCLMCVLVPVAVSSKVPSLIFVSFVVNADAEKGSW
jgi:hypothetical protein